jgi:arginine/serine-rich splicing factor 4/5/6/transcription factor SPN1
VQVEVRQGSHLTQLGGESLQSALRFHTVPSEIPHWNLRACACVVRVVRAQTGVRACLLGCGCLCGAARVYRRAESGDGEGTCGRGAVWGARGESNWRSGASCGEAGARARRERRAQEWTEGGRARAARRERGNTHTRPRARARARARARVRPRARGGGSRWAGDSRACGCGRGAAREPFESRSRAVREPLQEGLTCSRMRKGMSERSTSSKESDSSRSTCRRVSGKGQRERPAASGYLEGRCVRRQATLIHSAHKMQRGGSGAAPRRSCPRRPRLRRSGRRSTSPLACTPPATSTGCRCSAVREPVESRWRAGGEPVESRWRAGREPVESRWRAGGEPVESR